jgi:hypothetical protein
MSGGWRLLGFAAITLLVPAFIGQWNLTKRKFDTSPREKLAQKKPGIVLLGDSMLETHIDEPILRKFPGSNSKK